LYAFAEWAKQTTEAADLYRNEKTVDNESYKFADSYMEQIIGSLVRQAESNYEQMLFKDALKYGFFEMQTARDKYRELCGGEYNMDHKKLIKFIDAQTITLYPICPHVAEYVRYKYLNKSGKGDLQWPSHAQPDDLLLKSVEYLFEAVSSFRQRIKTHMTVASKKKGAVKVEKPTSGIIWVAAKYPPWQSLVMSFMSNEYKSGVPENKKLAADLSKIPDLKKYQKKVMPFVQMIKDRVAEIGVDKGLQQSCEFDETDVITKNLKYLINNLELEELTVRSTEEPGLDDEKLRELCCPGKPLITFSTPFKLPLEMINPQPSSGLWSTTSFLLNGDTVGKLKERLVRQKVIKDATQLKLYRYVDPQLGPRRIPAPLSSGTQHLEVIQDGSFDIDEVARSATLIMGKSTCEVGSQLVYTCV